LVGFTVKIIFKMVWSPVAVIFIVNYIYIFVSDKPVIPALSPYLSLKTKNYYIHARYTSMSSLKSWTFIFYYKYFGFMKLIY